MSETLSVIATLQAKVGREDTLRTLLVELVRATRPENGCLRYELNENRRDPGQFTIIEQWRDRAALDDHIATPHIQTARTRYPELVEGAVDLRLCSLIEP